MSIHGAYVVEETGRGMIQVSKTESVPSVNSWSTRVATANFTQRGKTWEINIDINNIHVLKLQTSVFYLSLPLKRQLRLPGC